VPAGRRRRHAASGFEGPPPTCIDQNKTYTALVETTAGNFTITLDPKSGPTP
jgi:hypothetical protein